jgi:hypothetical protein
MSRLPLLYILAAATCLIGGVAMGIGMGIAHDFRLAPVHAHLNLLGWTSLSLFGLAHRAWPELTRSRAAWVQFALCATAAFVFPAGIYLSIEHGNPALAIAASFAWMAGALMFLVRVAMLAFARAPRPMGYLQAAE